MYIIETINANELTELDGVDTLCLLSLWQLYSDRETLVLTGDALKIYTSQFTYLTITAWTKL